LSHIHNNNKKIDIKKISYNNIRELKIFLGKMENNGSDDITFEVVKELYKEMLKERAKEKYRTWDREYKKMKYETDEEFREKQKQKAKNQRERIKAMKLTSVTITSS
jgi:hypothetical protein